MMMLYEVIYTGRKTKNRQDYLAKKALPIFIYSCLFLPIFVYFNISANIYKLVYAIRDINSCLFLPIFAYF